MIYTIEGNNPSIKEYVEIFQDTGYVLESESDFKRSRFYLKFWDTLVVTRIGHSTKIVGTSYQITEQNDNLFLQNLTNHKMLKLKPFEGNRNDYYRDINFGLWFSQRLEIDKRLREKFPNYHYNYGIIYTLIENHIDVTIPYPEFSPWLEKFVVFYEDSLIKDNNFWSEKLDSITSNVSHLSYQEFKGLLIQLPLDNRRPSDYFKVAVVKFFTIHPQYFYNLVDDETEWKDFLIDLVVFNKELFEQIVSIEKNSPINKELKKRRRQETASNIFFISALSAYGAAILTGTFFLGRWLVKVF